MDKRIKNVISALMIGGGAMQAMRPGRAADRVQRSRLPRGVTRVAGALARRTKVGRAIGLIEMGVGLFMAAREFKRRR